MNLRQLTDQGVSVALGSDIGGGTSLSPFRTMATAYKIQALQQRRLHPVELFYLATLGGAEALSLESETGNFIPGKSADFVVLKPHRNRLLSERLMRDSDLIVRLFATIVHGDDRLTDEVFIGGKCVFSANQVSL